jgi:hypothetical protein
MNWKLIFSLSLFGLAMAFSTVYFIPSNAEPIFWLVIFIICAYFIAKNTGSNYFLHGLLVSIVNSVWITSAHIIFYTTYMANHLEEASMMNNMTVLINPKIMMLMTGIIIGIISGLILGLFSFIASKIVSKKEA